MKGAKKGVVIQFVPWLPMASVFSAIFPFQHQRGVLITLKSSSFFTQNLIFKTFLFFLGKPRIAQQFCYKRLSNGEECLMDTPEIEQSIENSSFLVSLISNFTQKLQFYQQGKNLPKIKISATGVTYLTQFQHGGVKGFVKTEGSNMKIKFFGPLCCFTESN